MPLQRPSNYYTVIHLKKKLEEYGVSLTTATLRKWQRKGYITFPKHPLYKNRTVFRSEDELVFWIQKMVEVGLLAQIPTEEGKTPDTFTLKK